MNNPKISVIIPVYNVEQYLRECLDSVVNQTFRDIEIICIDDGSIDNSLAILEEYAAKDCRFIVIHQENAGQSTARNKGLDIAKGEYIFFVDSDDTINLSTVEKAYNCASESDSELAMFYNDSVNLSSIDSPCFVSETTEDLLSKTKKAFFQGPGPCKFLWKRSLINRLNLRFIHGIKFEDVPFVLKGALNSNKISVLPEVLYYYRVNENSTTRSYNNHFCDYAALAYQKALDDIGNLNLTDECLQIIYRQKLLWIWYGYFYRTPKELLRQFRKNIKSCVFPKEVEWIKSNQLGLTTQQRTFFLSIYGDFITRLVSRIKIAKYKFADRVVRMLISHSPWLQQTLESVDTQRETIQKLHEQLDSQNDKQK